MENKGKIAFEEIIKNTMPYYSTLYDIDMYKEDKTIVIKNLDRLEHQDQVIKECIKLLSVEGENTKAKVKELLEGLVWQV